MTESKKRKTKRTAQREKNNCISANNRGVAIGGSVVDSVIVTGDENIITQISELFAPIYEIINLSEMTRQEKEDVTAEMLEIEKEIQKGDGLDESYLARRLRNIRRMAPDIFDVILAAMSGPGTVVSTVLGKIAHKVKAET